MNKLKAIKIKSKAEDLIVKKRRKIKNLASEVAKLEKAVALLSDHLQEIQNSGGSIAPGSVAEINVAGTELSLKNFFETPDGLEVRFMIKSVKDQNPV